MTAAGQLSASRTRLMATLLLVLCAALCVLPAPGRASLFEVHIPAGATKCYNEDLSPNTLFVAEVSPKHGAPVQVQVSLDGESELYFDETGTAPMKTAFTLPKFSRVFVCISKSPLNSKEATNVLVRILSGVLAKDFANIAKKTQFDPAVEELKLTEELLKEYASRQTKLVASDRVSQEVMDKTFKSVTRMAVVSVIVVCAGNAAVTLYLRSYFRQKKII